MYKYKLSLLILLSIVVISGCRKDKIETDIDRISPDVQVNIETAITGYVIDSNGMPIADADISVMNETTQSNQFGYFEITGLVDQQQAVVKVEKTSFFNQFKAFVPNKNVVDRTRIRLIEKSNPQIITASIGGQIIVEGNTKVDFQANSFIDESGTPYTGDVSVYSFYIDPTDPDLDMIMPGNLMARNVEEDLTLLQSFGMANVELEGSSGQKLNINKPATLTMGVPETISADAPAGIPLWYFDETSGYWVEEGTATLEGGKYIGSVNHFTFWNCDIDIHDFTFLSGHVVSGDGMPIVKVRITNLDTGASASDWTDNEGKFDGYVPKNENLLLEVLGVCGLNVIHSEEIGPFFNESVDVGVIDISTMTSELVLVHGMLIGCNQEPISNGQVVLSLTGASYPQSVAIEEDGSFSIVTSFCGATEIELIAIDYDNFVLGDPVIYPVSMDMDLGMINVCGEDIEESVVITAGGEMKIIPGCTVAIDSTAANMQYEFNFIDSLAGDGEEPVVYQLILYDYNHDLNDPSWTYSLTQTNAVVIDSIRVYQHFELTVPFTALNFEILQNNTNTGEVLSIKFSDCDVIHNDIFEDGSVITEFNPNSEVVLNAKVQ